MRIIAGERRWRAARLAGSATIRAIVENLDDVEAGELQTIENIQRVDLSPLEEASGYQYMLSLDGYNMARLVAGTGKSESAIRGKLKLLDLPEKVQAAVETGKLPPATAELIGRLGGDLQEQAAKEILTPNRYSGSGKPEPLSFREAKEAVTRLKGEEERRRLREKKEAELEGQGFTVIKGDERGRIVGYDGSVFPTCGYVGAKEVCPRDPDGRTWGQVLKGHADVARLAAVAESRREGYIGVEVFTRDFATSALKKLGLWDAAGSQKAKEKEDQLKKKRQQEEATERMHGGLDRIIDAARSQTSPRNVLLAAAEVLTGNYAKADFVAKRRLLHREGSLSDSAESLMVAARVMIIPELQGLVAELAAVADDREEMFFSDGIETVGRILGLANGAGEIADVCGGEEDA